MSHELISRNPDLLKLRNEGYNIGITSGHLVLSEVPYVNSSREVKLGTLVSVLNISGDSVSPKNHVAFFIGEQPCHHDGKVIEPIQHMSNQQTLASDLVVDRSFSNKPEGGYKDHYDKMTRYVAILSSEARAIDPSATAQTFPAIENDSEDAVFRYADTASSRAGITALTEKLRGQKVGIVGLGGTGSYVLDLVAKTSVEEIHLFDGDVFSNHNAFRAPGAASLADLQEKPKKVAYFHQMYSEMRRGIVPHDGYVDASNVDLVKEMDFVFICIDSGSAKQEIVEAVEEADLLFVDVGMGVDHREDGSLAGSVRTTTSTKEQRDHFRDLVSFSDGDADDVYTQNIQIADLNALNATLAVIKWKKLCGFYSDASAEYHSVYNIDSNKIFSRGES